jgi:transposase
VRLVYWGTVMGWRQGQAYGQDLRGRVLDASGTNAEVAMQFGVSESYVIRARSRRRRVGEDRAAAQCNHVPPKLGGLEQALAVHVAEKPDQTLAQLCDWVKVVHGVQVGVTTMWNTLSRRGLSLKKSRFTPRSRSART